MRNPEDPIQLVVSDGRPGLHTAIRSQFPDTVKHQHCIFHKLKNLADNGDKRHPLDYEQLQLNPDLPRREAVKQAKKARARCPGRKPHPFRSQPQWIENRGPWMVWEVEDGWVVLVDQEGIASIRRVGDRSRGGRAGREQKPASNSRELARAIYPVCGEGILEIERGMSGSVSS
jgi:hypothetical protein